MADAGLRGMSVEELRSRERELRETLARLHMKRHARRLEKPSELRRVASDGTVEEVLEVPAESIAGVEATREGFWCAGERGKLRLVRRRA